MLDRINDLRSLFSALACQARSRGSTRLCVYVLRPFEYSQSYYLNAHRGYKKKKEKKFPRPDETRDNRALRLNAIY